MQVYQISSANLWLAPNKMEICMIPWQYSFEYDMRNGTIKIYAAKLGYKKVR